MCNRRVTHFLIYVSARLRVQMSVRASTVLPCRAVVVVLVANTSKTVHVRRGAAHNSCLRFEAVSLVQSLSGCVVPS
jgi:hypothetical protein